MSVHDRPTAAELVAAVRAYLLDEVAPHAPDRRAKFRALIAANVLAIVDRELESAAQLDALDDAGLRALGYLDGSAQDRRRALCLRIRAGAYDDPARDAALLAYAHAHVEMRLRVANPAALERR